MNKIREFTEALTKLPVEIREIPISDEVRRIVKGGTPHRLIVTTTGRFAFHELAKATAECQTMIAHAFKDLEPSGCRYSIKSVPEHKSQAFLLRIDMYLICQDVDEVKLQPSI